MTEAKIREMLEHGENLTTEYKKSVSEISHSVYETVSSFSNRYGGYILLGVEEINHKGHVIGVNRNAAPAMKKNFANALNNDEIIYPSLYLTLEDFEIDGKLILYVYVPASSQVETYGKRIWDRNVDGDFDITCSTDLVANLYARKANSYSERKIFPFITMENLRMDLLPRIHRMALAKNAAHPWKGMDDMQLFRNAGLYEENYLTGERGFNLAAVLLFGKDEVIQSCCPGYRTDAIFRDEHPDRYDDRLIVETNLIESYDLLTGFIAKHTNDKFFLLDGKATSVRDIISREIVGNVLAHREFGSAFPAKIIVEPDRIVTENWNRPQIPGKINPEAFTPYPKNPTIAKFFVNIGLADTLGSGVRNLYACSEIYSGGEPSLEEGDVFRIYVPLRVNEQGQANRYGLNQRQRMILAVIETNPKSQVDEIAGLLQMSVRTVYREISEIKKKTGLTYDKKKQVWIR